MKQLAKQEGGFWQRHFPRAHQFFDDRKRFSPLLDAISAAQKIGRHGLGVREAVMDFETTDNPRRDQIARALAKALDRCKDEPDLQRYILATAQKLDKQGSAENAYIAAILYNVSTTFQIPALERSERMTRACELFARANCYDDAIRTGVYAIAHLHNEDDSVPIDRAERLGKILWNVGHALTLKRAEYAYLGLDIAWASEMVSLTAFLTSIEPRFGDLRQAAVAAFHQKLAELG